MQQQTTSITVTENKSAMPEAIQQLIEASSTCAGMEAYFHLVTLGSLKRSDVAAMLKANTKRMLKAFELMQRMHLVGNFHITVPAKSHYDSDVLQALNSMFVQAQHYEQIVFTTLWESDKTHGESGLSAELKSMEESDELHAMARKFRRMRKQRMREIQCAPVL